MNKKIWVDPEKCTACGVCELVCSFFREESWTHALSRIRIYEDEAAGIAIPMVCQQCEDPPCEMACLMNLIVRDEATGRFVRDVEKCIGCRACEATCPLVGCFYNYEKDAVLNCDLCGGDPICVKYCPEGALYYGETDGMVHEKNKDRFLRTVCF